MRWQGSYQEINTVWLRWANLDGTILPTAEEKAQEAEKKATQIEQKAQQLSAKLRELGINADDV